MTRTRILAIAAAAFIAGTAGAAFAQSGAGSASGAAGSDSAMSPGGGAGNSMGSSGTVKGSMSGRTGLNGQPCSSMGAAVSPALRTDHRRWLCLGARDTTSAQADAKKNGC